MAYHPKTVRLSPLCNLPMLSEGKVRQCFELPHHPDRLLFVVTDRISALNWILPFLIPDKGYILNALSIFWTRGLTLSTDLFACGSDIDHYLPSALRGNPELWKRAYIVFKKKVDPFEGVVRAHLGGTGWDEYTRTGGNVWGHELPKGLQKWQELPFPIFTPTDKSDTDDPINIGEFRKRWGTAQEALCLDTFNRARRRAKEKGIVLLDTKFELSGDKLCDERLTPDSSRYVDEHELADALAKEREPKSLDKEPVRIVCRSLGIGKLEPKNPADQKKFELLQFPTDMIPETTANYHSIFSRLTGMSLQEFWKRNMGIAA